LTLQELSEKQNSIVRITAELESRLDRIITVSNSFAVHPKIREMAVNSDWKQANETLELFNLQLNEPFVKRIAIVDANGFVRAQAPVINSVVGKSYEYRDWYEGVIRTGLPYVSEVFKRDAEPQYNVVVVATPIKNNVGALAGILIMQIRVDDLSTWINNVQSNEKQVIYLIDQNGKIIAHPKINPEGPIINLSTNKLIQTILNKESSVEIGQSPVDQKSNVVIAQKAASHYGWHILIEQSTDDTFSSRNKILIFVEVIFVIIFVLNLILIYAILQLIYHYRLVEEKKTLTNSAIE
jgi:hypothetical protein